jgi:phenylacetate-CoA ligase
MRTRQGLFQDREDPRRSSALTGPQLALDVWRVGRSGPDGIQRRQRQRLQELVSWAREKSPYYRQALRHLPASGPISLTELPPTTKRVMMDHFDDWVTARSVTRARAEEFIRDPSRVGDDFLGQYLLVTTSGSTGLPALVVFDRRALRVINAISGIRGLGSVPSRGWWRVLRNGGRQCAIYATGGHFLAETFMQRRLRQRPFRRRFAEMLSVMEPLDELVDELNRFRPAFLGSYPSMLDALAREQEAGRLAIAPALVTSGGEHLSRLVEQRIADAWNCRVWESYNATEAMPLTVPCRLGRFHVNADWMILEPVDEDKKPVPPGHPSTTTLVTNLANRVQPIIRYELGRQNDVLHMTRRDGRHVDVLPLALGSVVEETPGVRRYQAIQTGPSSLSVRLEDERGADARQVWTAVEHRLHGFLSRQGLDDVTVHRDPLHPQADPRSGKLRQVLSRMPSGA